MDELLRRLERLATTGDPEAIESLRRWRERVPPHRPAFFLYRQNNVMGIMITRHQEGIGPYVAIEAFDGDQADERLQDLLGDSYNGYCECCGRRWGKADYVFTNWNGLHIWWNEQFAWLSSHGRKHEKCYIHLLDGSITTC